MSDEIERMAREGDSVRLAGLLRPTGDGDEQTVPAMGGDVCATPGPGQSVGRYKLLQEIGEGGFGTVFMAEQQEPVVRRVALKVIKVGMDTKQVIARFEAERQALAIMDHPNIAKVFDAGQTETGRPYFVMELIRGIPITEYCDQNNLSVRDRLALFVQVCQAAQHAHTKGIIHRDIKPSNVLVTMHDGAPVPKVIDFGVAKAIDRQLTEKTLFTEHRQIVGTPEYMSPEQAEMSGLDIDTRSDVYSLGVLLYELLTGTTPFDAKELRAKGYTEIQRIVREVEPPKPSTRVSSLGQTIGAVAKHRHSDPRQLCRLFQGELDWVVMKCLEKDRTRRYETANGLARDIQRYLKDEAVEASPPSAGYKLRKFTRRYRVPLAVASGFAAVLIAATAISTWQAVRATRAKNAEAKQTALARDATAKEAAQRREAEAEASLLESIFQDVDPFSEDKDGPDFRSQIVAQLDQAAAKLDKEPELEPLVRARLRSTLANSEHSLGEFAKAEGLFKLAISEQQSHGAGDAPTALRMMRGLARTYTDVGNYPEAAKLLEFVRERQTRTLGENHRDTLQTLRVLGSSYVFAGRLREATEILERVQDQDTKQFGPDDPQTQEALKELGSAYTSAGRYADAIAILKVLRDRDERIWGPQHPMTLGAVRYLAEAYHDSGHVADAVKIYENLRDQSLRVLGPDNPRTLFALESLGTAYADAGQASKGIELLENLREREVRMWGASSPHSLIVSSNLAYAYSHGNRVPDAIRLFEELRGPFEKQLGPNHPRTLLQLQNLAAAYHAAGRVADAVALLERVVPQTTAALGREHAHAMRAKRILASAYMSLGRSVDSVKLLEDVRDGQIKNLGSEDVFTLETMGELAIAYQDVGRADDAMRTVERLKGVGHDHEDTMRVLSRLGANYCDHGRYVLAEPILRDLAEWRATNPSEFTGVAGRDLIVPRLIRCYEQLRMKEAAAAWERKLRGLLEDEIAAKSKQLGAAPPNSRQALLTRVSVIAPLLRLGRFSEAQAEIVTTIQRNAIAQTNLYALACLQAYLGQDDAYRNSRSELIRRFRGTSDRSIADRTAKAALVVPPSTDELGPAIQLADLAVAGGPTPLISYYQITKGIAEYRRGDFDAAEKWLSQGRRWFDQQLRLHDPQSNWPEVRATASFFLAMNHFRAGRKEQASVAFALARHQLDMQVPNLSSCDPIIASADWFIAQIAAREAEALMGKEAPMTQPAGSGTGSDGGGKGVANGE